MAWKVEEKRKQEFMGRSVRNSSNGLPVMGCPFFDSFFWTSKKMNALCKRWNKKMFTGHQCIQYPKIKNQ